MFLLSSKSHLLEVQVNRTSRLYCLSLLLLVYFVIMAPREKVKSDIFESRVDEGMLE